MKRLIALISALVLAALPLCARAETGDARRVYASTAPAFALTEGMLRGVEQFEARQLMQPQLDCVRLYELSDWDVVQLSAAELCVVWGEGLESFAGTLTSAESGPAVITLADAGEDFGALAEELEDYDYYGHFSGADPHSYMSLARMDAALDALYESLALLYPELADALAANYTSMEEQLAEAQAALRDIDAGDGAVALLVEGLPYMAQELGLSWQYVYPREPASAVEGADWDELLERLSASGAAAVALERQAPAAITEGLRGAGWEVRQVALPALMDAPTLEEYLSALLICARTLAGGE